MPSKFSELSNFISKTKSDPFIPREIRQKVVDLLEKRTQTMFVSFMEELEQYKEGLKAGKYWDNLDTNHHWFHNKILDRMYKNGCGVSQVEEAAHKIRDDIQQYFESFDPLRKAVNKQSSTDT